MDTIFGTTLRAASWRTQARFHVLRRNVVF